MEGAGVFLLAAALIFSVVILGVVWTIQRKIRNLSRMACGTDSLLEGLKQQEEEFARTPKSVAGMTSLYLPRIQKDFPEFSLEEFIARSENLLTKALMSVQNQKIVLGEGASGELEESLRLWIKRDEEQGIREMFHSIVIHKTEISQYAGSSAGCSVTVQSAVEYQYGRQKRDGQMMEEPELIQTRFDLKWVYAQDVEGLPESVRARAAHCPNCGAPVSVLSARVCEYCQAAIEPINLRAWFLINIREC